MDFFFSCVYNDWTWNLKYHPIQPMGSTQGDQEIDRRASAWGQISNPSWCDGIGKDFHDGECDRERAKADAGHRSEQDPRGTTSAGISDIFPQKRGGIFCFLLWLLPAGSLYCVIWHLHWKRIPNKWRDWPSASCGDGGGDVAQKTWLLSLRYHASTAWDRPNSTKKFLWASKLAKRRTEKN